MQRTGSEAIEFVKAAPPVQEPGIMSGFGSECRFPPLKLLPLSLWSWQDTLKAVVLDRVNIVSHYDTVVHSPSTEFTLPSVVSLKTYVKPPRHPAFTRFNVFLRDGFSCQYCGAPNDLTFDHVIPRRAGGRTTWKMWLLPAAVQSKKGGRMPKKAGMVPRQNPHQPTVYELHENGRKFPPNYCHESWQDYLYWDTELEP